MTKIIGAMTSKFGIIISLALSIVILFATIGSGFYALGGLNTEVEANAYSIQSIKTDHASTVQEWVKYKIDYSAFRAREEESRKALKDRLDYIVLQKTDSDKTFDARLNTIDNRQRKMWTLMTKMDSKLEGMKQ